MWFRTAPTLLTQGLAVQGLPGKGPKAVEIEGLSKKLSIEG